MASRPGEERHDTGECDLIRRSAQCAHWLVPAAAGRGHSDGIPLSRSEQPAAPVPAGSASPSRSSEDPSFTCGRRAGPRDRRGNGGGPEGRAQRRSAVPVASETGATARSCASREFHPPTRPLWAPAGHGSGSPQGGEPRARSRTVALHARLPRRADPPGWRGSRHLQRRGRRRQPDLVPDPARARLPGAHGQHHQHDRDLAGLRRLRGRLPQRDRRPDPAPGPPHPLRPRRRDRRAPCSC